MFPGLKLVPSQLVLLPGGSYQVKWSGGPPVRVALDFHVDNQTVCTADASGKVTANEVGSTLLHVMAQATDDEGNRFDYGTDTIQVVVRALSGKFYYY